jgi:hypothetical protein
MTAPPFEWGKKLAMALEISTLTPEAAGENAPGNITLIDLAEILDQHKLWVESGGESGSKADLCSVNLANADLTGVNLQGAFLRICRWPICAEQAWCRPISETQICWARSCAARI